MAFLGNSPSEVYKSLSKQVITGDGSVSYTLDNNVGSAVDLEVFVNNVRQEPDVAYTAGGALITFTTALEATDECYVIYQGKAISSNVIQSSNIGESSITETKIADSSVTTNKIADNSITDSKINSITPEQYMTTSFGRRNLIINGDMQVWQRGTSASITSNVAGYSTADRWRHEFGSLNLGSSVVFEQSTDTPEDFKYSLKITNTTGAVQTPLAVTDYCMISQKPEMNVVKHLNWGLSSAKKVTLSFWVKSSISGTWLETGFRRATGTTDLRSVYKAITINSANTWEKKIITFDGDTQLGENDVTWNDKAMDFFFSIHGQVGSSTAAADGVWETGNLLGGTQGTNTIFLETTGATLFLTGIQLEVGEISTPFEHRSYGEELALCQRYYQIHYCAGSGVQNSATSAFAVSHLPVTMRDRPTLSTRSGGWTNINLEHDDTYDVTSGVISHGSAAGDPDSMSSFVIDFVTSGSNTTGYAIVAVCDRNDDYFTYDAEL